MATAPGKPSPAPRPTGKGGTATGSHAPLQSSGAFSVDQLSPDSTNFPAVYEAAVLYAADYYDAAQDVLRNHLKIPEGKNSIRTWLMLFDLYQLTHNRREFDSLSMLFTVEFERSPPVWVDGTGNADPRRKEKRDYKDFYLLSPRADGALLEEFDKFEIFTKEAGSCRVEFSKIKSILVEEAELFSIVLQRIRRQKMPVWFNYFDDFTALLKKQINDATGRPINASQGYWSLLFELYILDGRLDEYEELGLEYAVAFEMSPPAWELVKRPASASAVTAAADDAESNPDKEGVGFPLRGVINVGSKEMYQQLAIYANSRQEVVIDMSGLLRIDFNAVGGFFEAVRAIHLGQKRVILSNLNEMVAGLLEVFGMPKHAILMRKKAA